MKYFSVHIKAIFCKDIAVELRAKQVLPTMVVLGMLIVWILRLVCEAAQIDSALMGPAALWIALLFAALPAQERAFASEQQHGCIYGLLLAPVAPETIYLAKLLVNIVMLCVFEIIIVPVVIIFFRLDVHGQLIRIILVLLLGNLGISAIGTLFSAVVQLARTRGSILSIIVLAVLMPMMIPSLFATLVIFGSTPAELIGTGAFIFVGGFSDAIGYMVAFDAIFTTICWLLSGYIIKE